MPQLVKNPPIMQKTPVQFLGREDSQAPFVAQVVKNSPAMWETWV